MLFEFSDNQNDFSSLDQRIKLEKFLKEIWAKRYCAYAKELEEDVESEDEDLKQTNQPFLRFDGKQYRTRNFVGFIQFEKQTIEIFPKVFRNANLSAEEMLRHLFYWFSYCRKLYFPVLESSLDKLNVDSLPELLIWHFSNYCESTISIQPFSRYELIEEALQTPRGRIDFPAYIRNGLSTGNYHKIDCQYESFDFNNSLNRAIKYVCRLLMSISQNPENQRKLQEICFILDDVDDVQCSSIELDRIVLNPVFSAYEPIKEWCKRIIDQQLYSSSSYESMQWSLLLPMEYVFEDFVTGFLIQNYSHDFIVEPQRSNYYLTENNVFQLRHDILLTRRLDDETILIDMKYKIRSGFDISDKKKGVASADMYQMVSYAYRRGCKKVLLLYPNAGLDLQQDEKFNIRTDFRESEIEIHICEIPFWGITKDKKIEDDLKEKLNLLLA